MREIGKKVVGDGRSCAGIWIFGGQPFSVEGAGVLVVVAVDKDPLASSHS